MPKRHPAHYMLDLEDNPITALSEHTLFNEILPVEIRAERSGGYVL